MEIRLTDAWEGYLIHAQARGLSALTLRGYVQTFGKFLEFMGTDPPVQSITKDDIERFQNELAAQKLSGRTRRNHYTGLSALWTWLLKERLVEYHIVRQTNPPKAEVVAVVPFSEQDIKLMLGSLTRSRSYRRRGEAEATNHALPETLRNRAIILLLLDTGIRASELCGLKVKNVDLRNQRITVFGKGSKHRMVPISVKTTQALWRYRTQRDPQREDAAFFITHAGITLKANTLRLMLNRLQERCGVDNIHAHRFRHTFAITYLRNGGDIFTLQNILGHTDLTMVKRYSAIAQADVESMHRRASPVANWDVG